MVPPEKTTSISLAKALKLKNRITGKVNTLTSDITANNSYLVENEAYKVDVLSLMEKRKTLVHALVTLKNAIYKANLPISFSIELLREKKSDCTFLKSIHVFEGVQVVSYSEAKNEYVSQIKKVELNEMVSKLQNEIDDLQDRIDAFNATSDTVVLPEYILDLLKD